MVGLSLSIYRLSRAELVAKLKAHRRLPWPSRPVAGAAWERHLAGIEAHKLRRAAGLARTLHAFSDTGEAYDATQCREHIATGDALVIEGEGVVGLAWAWPVAVTVAHGNLHEVGDDVPGLLAEMKVTRDQVRAAVLAAVLRGYPVRPAFSSYVGERG